MKTKSFFPNYTIAAVWEKVTTCSNEFVNKKCVFLFVYLTFIEEEDRNLILKWRGQNDNKIMLQEPPELTLTEAGEQYKVIPTYCYSILNDGIGALLFPRWM